MHARLAGAFETVRKGGLFPLAWLASVDQAGQARVRTVKVLGFNLAVPCFYIGCHRNHAKVAQLLSNPRAELCLLDPQEGLQIRFECRSEGSNETLRERFWQKLSPRSRQELYRAHPRQEKASENFALLTFAALRAELLELHDGPPRRYSYPDLQREVELEA